MGEQKVSIGQLLNRMHSGHRHALLWAAGEKPHPVQPSSPDWSHRGFIKTRNTLRRWGALDGDTLTEIGRELLAAHKAKYPHQYSKES